MNSEEAGVYLELDPFWRERAANIRNVRDLLSSPKTQVGEKLCKDVWNNPVFRVYNRLQPIFSGLVSLVEIEEISISDNKEFATNPSERRIILKAFKLLIEDTLKDDYSGEGIRYEDYRHFFESMLHEFSQVEKSIEDGTQHPQFVNTLFIIFQQQVNILPNIENFGINIEAIRKRIAEYIPKLNNVDEINMKTHIQELWEEALAEEKVDAEQKGEI
jgi:hypothetical protein